MKNSYQILFTLSLIFTSTALLAQGPPPATPIDGGLSLLLAAGGAYGLKKIHERRKKQ
ncbi:MAG: hypothetical protein RIC03_12405 [Cyclobacteriaceae bacterium]